MASLNFWSATWVDWRRPVFRNLWHSDHDDPAKPEVKFEAILRNLLLTSRPQNFSALLRTAAFVLCWVNRPFHVAFALILGFAPNAVLQLVRGMEVGRYIPQPCSWCSGRCRWRSSSISWGLP
jgi:hypothetical protein